METQKQTPSLHGLIAEFDSPESLLNAAIQVGKAGFTHTDAYSPYPVHGLIDALQKKQSNLPIMIFCGGVIGGCAGFLLQYIASAVAYPYLIGGRPLNSWPAFIPIIFELTVLFAALTAVIGMFTLNKLPMPYHPVFNVEQFAEMTKNKFFLLIQTSDPKFNQELTHNFMMNLSALSVHEVEE